MTKILPATAENIRTAAGILRSGGLVAFPTETVYGLGADAENPAAVRAMFAAKGRPADHPVIVHLADSGSIDRFAAEVPQTARRLALAFWPGPMTLVLRRSERISDLVTGGLDTVGLRVPAHPVALALLREFGGPIAAPSANRFGRVSATRASHVLDELNGYVDLILDGGECNVGVESTIIDLSGGEAAILRPGAVTWEQVESVLPGPLSAPDHRPRVSGSLPSHYAPRARVEITPAENLFSRAAELASAGNRVAILGHQQPPAMPHGVTFLQHSQEPEALAHSLYDLLRRVDELHCDVALVALPAEHGLGMAIADRLRRSAGPRDPRS